MSWNMNIDRYKHRTQNKNQKWLQGVQTDEQFSVDKNYGEYKEADRHQTCGNWYKKKSSSDGA